MGAILDLMKRLGFVKLDRYGLVLTADDRVLSNRPVLDDGLGNRIVGWTDGDLAAMQLVPFGAPARPMPMAPMPMPRPAMTMPAVTMPMPMPMPAVVMPAAAMPVMPKPLPGMVVAKTPVIPAAPAMAPVVAPAPVVEEDDWEWEIAMARARAVAEPPPTVETPIPVMTPAVMQPAHRRATYDEPPHTPVTMQVPPDVMSRMAAVASLWPEAAHESWNEEATPEPAPAPRVVPRAPVRVARADSQPATVIPVPRMPKATPSTYKPVPVVRSSAPEALRRTVRAPVSDQTIQTYAAPPPANEDRTSPGIVLPPAGATPSRVVATKQR